MNGNTLGELLRSEERRYPNMRVSDEEAKQCMERTRQYFELFKTGICKNPETGEERSHPQYKDPITVAVLNGETSYFDVYEAVRNGRKYNPNMEIIVGNETLNVEEGEHFLRKTIPGKKHFQSFAGVILSYILGKRNSLSETNWTYALFNQIKAQTAKDEDLENFRKITFANVPSHDPFSIFKSVPYFRGLNDAVKERDYDALESSRRVPFFQTQ